MPSEAPVEQSVVACCFCDWSEIVDRDRAAMRARLQEHVLVCAAHPMRAVEAERDQARREMALLRTMTGERATSAAISAASTDGERI